MQGVYQRLLSSLGPELQILRETPVEAIAGCGWPAVALGVRRMREGKVEILPGYDGVYGKVQVLSEADRTRLSGQEALFDMAPVEPQGSGIRDQTPAGADGDLSGRRADDGTRNAKAEVPPDGLDDAQQAAVAAEEGPVVVVAGSGTGKTRVLTHRIAHLIRERNVAPGSILAVTFTNRAAGEMHRRIGALLPEGDRLEEVTVGTFHRVALDLLKAYFPERSKGVVDEVEPKSILADALADAKLSLPVARVASAISLAKGEGIGPEAVGDEEVRAAYLAYQERLRVYGVGDYDDILLDLFRLLEEKPGVLETIRDRYAHLLVNEFQDVNAIQYRLVAQMAGEGRGLFVIGDPDQAIYGFRGASPVFFGRLFEDFTSARKVLLERTYRSTPEIVRAASGVIAGIPDREPVHFAPVREWGVGVRLLSAPGETAEGIAVVREIGRMVGGVDMLQSDG